jgi:putative lipoprotein
MFRTPEPYAIDPLAPADPLVIMTARARVATPAADPAPPADPATPATPALLGITWKAAAIAGDPVLVNAVPTLQIGSDRRAGGESGSTSWFAEAQLNAATIRFGNVVSTLRGCTQSVTLQERAYYDALAGAATWAIDGDTLSLYSPGGTVLATFTR